MFKAGLKRFGSWFDGNFIVATLTGLVGLFLFVFFFHNIFVTIPPGHGGVMWYRFLGGTRIDSDLGEGTKLIFPWDRVYVYDLRVRQATETLDVLTKEGLQISVGATLRYRVNPKAMGTINALAGPQFIDTLITPSIGASVRLETAKYTAEEIYSTNRNQIELAIQSKLTKVIDDLIHAPAFAEPEILVEDFWFRSIKLPDVLKAAIETKLTQRQTAEQYVYVLQREEQERRRKEIEARGIKAFQDIVSSGISENYLRWKGIDATVKLSESPNAKIVVIGSREGLPLILGSPEFQNTSPPPMKAAGSADPTAPAPLGSAAAAPPAKP
jgi:prohibitin 2